MALQIVKSAPSHAPKRKPVKNKKYLVWLHELPCIVTGRYGVEAAHLSYASPVHGHYGRGKGTKASDRWALPLCPEQHAAQHGMNEREYWRQVGINPHIKCLILWGIWNELGEDATEAATAVIMQGVTGR